MEPQPEPEPESRPLTYQENMSIKLAVHEHCKDWDPKDDELCKKHKIIHQIFLKLTDKTMKDYDYDKNSEVWRKWCKSNGYRYMLHNEASLNKVMTSKDRQMRNRVKNEERHPFIDLDYGKLIALRSYGGAYIDLDVLPKSNTKSYLERPAPILSCWRDKKDQLKCNTQVMILDKDMAKQILDYAYEKYETKSKIRVYDERKIRFCFQVAGPDMVCKWAKDNGIKYQKDFHKYFIDKETRAWMPDKSSRRTKKKINLQGKQNPI